MKLGKTGFNFAMATEPGKMVFAILMLIHWILGWFVMSVVVFLRRDFGERYLSWVNIIFGLTAVSLFTGMGNSFLSGSIKNMSVTIELAYWGFILAAIAHRVMIWRKNKRGQLWHSYNAGESLIKLPFISVETMQKWIEPAILLLLSCMFQKASMHLWLMIGAIALFVHEQVAFYMQRQQFLDMRDAMIESKNWSAVMSGKPVQQTQGFTIAKSNLALVHQSPEMEEAFAGLSDDVKSIMDQEAA